MVYSNKLINGKICLKALIVVQVKIWRKSDQRLAEENERRDPCEMFYAAEVDVSWCPVCCMLSAKESKRGRHQAFKGLVHRFSFFFWCHTSLKGDCPAHSPPALWRPGKLAAVSQTASQLQFHLGLRFWQWHALLLVTQSFLTLCNPMDYSLPGSSVQGIFQSILERVAIPFSKVSS